MIWQFILKSELISPTKSDRGNFFQAEKTLRRICSAKLEQYKPLAAWPKGGNSEWLNNYGTKESLKAMGPGTLCTLSGDGFPDMHLQL